MCPTDFRRGGGSHQHRKTALRRRRHKTYMRGKGERFEIRGRGGRDMVVARGAQLRNHDIAHMKKKGGATPSREVMRPDLGEKTQHVPF